ncbi:MAG TPA: hypothetical protein PLU75_09145 [Oscillospiraceae bacterium]|nr:hypothetical protein [Oscillospiraceae bacterium]HRW57344.1 hypothetical protein [Oscillospiraceae bacterium]
MVFQRFPDKSTAKNTPFRLSPAKILSAKKGKGVFKKKSVLFCELFLSQIMTHVHMLIGSPRGFSCRGFFVFVLAKGQQNVRHASAGFRKKSYRNMLPTRISR